MGGVFYPSCCWLKHLAVLFSIFLVHVKHLCCVDELRPSGLAEAIISHCTPTMIISSSWFVRSFFLMTNINASQYANTDRQHSLKFLILHNTSHNITDVPRAWDVKLETSFCCSDPVLDSSP
jgi:hypothetical protein